MFEPHIDQPRSRVKALAQTYENYRIANCDGPGLDREYGQQHRDLWKTGPATTQDHRINYINLTPAQKTQAVANGQRELMEMIKNMPETSYELSLKDLVEHKAATETKPYESYSDEDEVVLCKRRDGEQKMNKNTIANNNRKNKSEQTAQIYRSVSLDSGGLLLKMGFLVFRGRPRKKTKKKSTNINPGEPGLVNSASDGSRKSVDKEWWVKQKRFSGSRDSENGGISSSNSGSTGSSDSSRSIRSIGNTRHGHTCAPSCWPIFRMGKGETQK